MGSKLPLISVIVPAYNEQHYIKKCLESLMNQDLAKTFYEIIVIDNASTDKTSQIVKKLPVKLVYEPERSVVKARQRGVNEALGSIVASADADTIYPTNWLTNIKKIFDNNKDTVCIVGWIHPSNQNSIVRFTVCLTQTINLLINKITGKTLFSFAANMAFKKQILEKIGGYPIHLPQLGDQGYVVSKFSKFGKIDVNYKISCTTSSRRYENSNSIITFIKYNIWHNIIGYTVNRITGKQFFGPAPAIRDNRKSES